MRPGMPLGNTLVPGGIVITGAGMAVRKTSVSALISVGSRILRTWGGTCGDVDIALEKA